MSIAQKLTQAGVALAGAAAAALVVVGAAQAADVSVPVAGAPVKPQRSCFFMSEWESWHAPNPDVIYLRVRLHDVYRVELDHSEPMLQDAFVHLIDRRYGDDTVCGPLDLNLEVSDGEGMRAPLFLKSITKLTPEQIAAIPSKDRP